MWVCTCAAACVTFFCSKGCDDDYALLILMGQEVMYQNTLVLVYFEKIRVVTFRFCHS